MRRGALLLAVVVTVVTGFLAGCAAPTDGPTPTPTETTAAPTETPTPIGTEYVVSAGSVPGEIRSVEVTLQVVFVERAGDVGPCWQETFGGPYEPTVTPVAPPRGECYRTEPVTLNLTAMDGERSLGRLTAPGRFDAGHALLVTNATATYENGTAVTTMRGAGGKRVSVVEGSPAGPYQVRLSVEAYRDRPYDYWLVADSRD